MNLTEALRIARIAVDAPHPDGYVSENTYVSRAVLRTVLDELARMQCCAAPLDSGLRDTFATAAMQAGTENLGGMDRGAMRYIAEASYGMADAMLTARGTR